MPYEALHMTSSIRDLLFTVRNVCTLRLPKLCFEARASGDSSATTEIGEHPAGIPITPWHSYGSFDTMKWLLRCSGESRNLAFADNTIHVTV